MDHPGPKVNVDWLMGRYHRLGERASLSGFIPIKWQHAWFWLGAQRAPRPRRFCPIAVVGPTSQHAAAIAAPLRSPRALETMVRYRGAVLAELLPLAGRARGAARRRAPFRARAAPRSDRRRNQTNSRRPAGAMT